MSAYLKQRMKRIAIGVAAILVAPLIAIAKIEELLSRSESWFTGCGGFLSLIPGRTGNYLRLAFYRFTLEECSNEVTFYFGTIVTHRSARIGYRVGFGYRCHIGTATIGDHVMVASRVSILSGARQHDVSDTTKNITEDEPVFERVHIGSNTWIGETAIVSADVGERCVVAAGSVVLRPVADFKMAMGNPARVMERWPAGPSR